MYWSVFNIIQKEVMYENKNKTLFVFLRHNFANKQNMKTNRSRVHLEQSQ